MRKGRWIKERKRPSEYPETEQQRKIREAGLKIKEECSGLKGKEFLERRGKILKEIFNKS